MVHSQKKKDNHRLALWATGGYSTLLQNADDIVSKGRPGGSVGVGYEWNRKKFLLQTGFEFNYMTGSWRYPYFIHEVPMVDTEGQAYTGRYHFNENRDVYALGYVNLPLMVGAQFGSVYFLVGGKVGMNLFGSSRVDNLLHSMGLYEEFIGEFQNMPNHDFYEREVVADYPVQTGLHYAVALEVGWDIRAKKEEPYKWDYRLALYADYGLGNIHTTQYGEAFLLEAAGTPSYEPRMNSLMRSELMTDKTVNPLFVGVKFTALYNFPKRRDCRCEWW